MEYPTIDAWHKKSVGVVARFKGFLRRVMRQAGRIVSAFAYAFKLIVEKEHRSIIARRDYLKLGEELYRLMEANPDISDVRVTGFMRDMVKNIKAARTEINDHREKLDRMTVVSPAPTISQTSYD